MSQPLVSVIVPIYNVENYLGDCLESILGQSYKNIEIICVNDGTKDGSEAVIDKYAQKDHRIKKVNQKNAGLNMARATGFKHSTGDYITFVDSDDAIHIKTIEIALENILSTNSEIAIFGFKEFKKTTSEFKSTVNEKTKVLSGKQQILRYLLVNDPEYIEHTLQLTVWGKLYKRNIVNKIDWTKSDYRQHEDLFWTPDAFSKVTKNICLNKSGFYFYRRDPSRNVLSRATTKNSYDGKPVGYLEIVHKFSTLIEGILTAAQLKSSLKREFEDVIYGMYRGHLQDLINKNAVKSENNIDYIGEYYKYSQQHIANLVGSLRAQDGHIKSLDTHIKIIESRLQDLDNKLNPSSASLAFLMITTLQVLKYKAKMYYKKIFSS